MEPVRIAVVGVGNFGRLHARTLAGLAEARLVGAVDSNPAAVESLRADVPDVRGWSDLDEALRSSEVEAFVIATRTESHVPIAQKILAAGRPVLIEKPLAGDAATAAQLAPLVKAGPTKLMMAHIILFAPEFQRLLRESKSRGRIAYFHAFRHRPAKTRELYPEETPFRLTMVHDLYMALALMGAQEPISISGELRRQADGLADLGYARFQWPGGTWGHFTASFLTPPGMPADGFDRFELFGEGWAARMDLNPQPLQIWSDRAEWPIGLDINDDPAAPSGWLADELRHFCRVVRGAADVPIGARFEDAMMVQRWIERLEQCAQEKR